MPVVSRKYQCIIVYIQWKISIKNIKNHIEKSWASSKKNEKSKKKNKRERTYELDENNNTDYRSR